MNLLLILAATALCAQAADQATIDDFCINSASVSLDRYAASGESCNGQFKSESCQEDKIENACADEADPTTCRIQTSSNDCCAYLTMCSVSVDCTSYDVADCDNNCNSYSGGAKGACKKRCQKCPECLVADAFCIP
jgi:hypothetical protein